MFFMQTKSTARWLQITRWEMMRLINDTEDGFNTIKEELCAIRIMVMQHCYVLDLMTTMECSVYATVGTVCIFIPANEVKNGTLTEAMKALRSLQKKMVGEGGAPGEWFEGWADWLPPWMSGLFKTLLFIIVVSRTVYCGSQIVIACCKRVSTKIGGMFTSRPVTHKSNV